MSFPRTECKGILLNTMTDVYGTIATESKAASYVDFEIQDQSSEQQERESILFLNDSWLFSDHFCLAFQNRTMISFT